MKNLTWILIGLCSMLALSCKTTETLPANIADSPLLFELSRGGCFGTCPIYKLRLYTNQWVAYEGIRFVDREGMHYRRISKGDYKAIKVRLESANLGQYQDNYPNTITDLPNFTISHADGEGNSKSVSGNQNLPKEVMELIDELDRLSKEGEWIKDPNQDTLPVE